jgi:hypothetical protein
MHNIPNNLLKAVSLTESGKWHEASNRMIPWPWAVNFKGKTINIPAVRTFVPWVITVMDDVTATSGTSNTMETDLHRKFMDWSDTIVDTGENYGITNLASAVQTGAASTISTGNSWTVTHLDHNSGQNSTLKTFKLKNTWPIQVGPIQLDMNQDARIAMFNVTLAYTHIED